MQLLGSGTDQDRGLLGPMTSRSGRTINSARDHGSRLPSGSPDRYADSRYIDGMQMKRASTLSSQNQGYSLSAAVPLGPGTKFGSHSAGSSHIHGEQSENLQKLVGQPSEHHSCLSCEQADENIRHGTHGSQTERARSRFGTHSSVEQSRMLVTGTARSTSPNKSGGHGVLGVQTWSGRGRDRFIRDGSIGSLIASASEARLESPAANPSLVVCSRTAGSGSGLNQELHALGVGCVAKAEGSPHGLLHSETDNRTSGQVAQDILQAGQPSIRSLSCDKLVLHNDIVGEITHAVMDHVRQEMEAHCNVDTGKVADDALLMERQFDPFCRSKFLQLSEEVRMLSKELETLREDICHWSDMSSKVARLEDAMEAQEKKVQEIQQSLHPKSADVNGTAPVDSELLWTQDQHLMMNRLEQLANETDRFRCHDDAFRIEARSGLLEHVSIANEKENQSNQLQLTTKLCEGRLLELAEDIFQLRESFEEVYSEQATCTKQMQGLQVLQSEQWSQLQKQAKSQKDRVAGISHEVSQLREGLMAVHTSYEAVNRLVDVQPLTRR